ncbi:hypothetical protein OIE62_00685 [Streptomyces scopuliridis]|uniref:Uncharacterized protein n=1 Tax=Streptomyces scopuliridis TaxID=452529 RepID=A0ACD4ZW75_9ACTN|nr:hypothetical protein [Streptomyces scopuliridis]WSC02768.1 hypothetical protein OG835_41150 [Streptomyces scopuliridis]WSC03699.1 hypothetical protein OIE62_00685 [Streptomyces scopuliridis]
MPSLGRETLRRILREGRVFLQTTTWRSSNAPDSIAEVHRILALYDTPPTDGWVVCVNEFGPLNRMPRKGKLNWIESEFAALRYCALGGTDHRSHGEQNAAIHAYISWRNTKAGPKTGFAPVSPIRTWNQYPTRAA